MRLSCQPSLHCLSTSGVKYNTRSLLKRREAVLQANIDNPCVPLSSIPRSHHTFPLVQVLIATLRHLSFGPPLPLPHHERTCPLRQHPCCQRGSTAKRPPSETESPVPPPPCTPRYGPNIQFLPPLRPPAVAPTRRDVRPSRFRMVTIGDRLLEQPFLQVPGRLLHLGDRLRLVLPYAFQTLCTPGRRPRHLLSMPDKPHPRKKSGRRPRPILDLRPDPTLHVTPLQHHGCHTENRWRRPHHHKLQETERHQLPRTTPHPPRRRGPRLLEQRANFFPFRSVSSFHQITIDKDTIPLTMFCIRNRLVE